MLFDRVPINNLCFIRLNPGDDVLLSLRETVEKHEIKNAVILSGVGSTTSHHYHVVASANMPPGNIFTKGDKPSDIVSINGIIINGRIHAHIIHTDKDIAYGGHLEEGVKVLTFSVITLAEVDKNFDKWDTRGCIEELLKND